MKILFAISSLGIGGEQRVASILTDQFTLKGHKVEIVTFSKPEKAFQFNSNIKIHLLKNKSFLPKNLYRLLAIRKLIKTGEFDIVIGFAVIPSIICSLASIKTEIPVIVCERNDPAIYNTRMKISRWIAYYFSKGAVFQTSDAREYFKKRFKDKSVIIPNPINVKTLPERKNVIEKKKVVNTARLTDAKNQSLLIRAFANIEKEFPDYTLEIYGDGPNKNGLTKLIENLSLERKVKLKEATPHVLEEIVDSSLFVLSSRHEGYPNSLAEAMCIGLPVISTNCRIGGPKDMIVNNENGVLVKENDLEELTNAMKRCLYNDTFRSKIGRNARDLRRNLDAKEIASQWLEFLKTKLNPTKQ